MKAFFQNRVVAIVITALVVCGCLAYGWLHRPAKVPTPTVGDWVYDGANVLSSSTEFQVGDFNRTWQTSYGSVMAVATVPSTTGWSLEDYAGTLGSNWGLQANDALLLLDVGGGQYWMTSGERLENKVGYDTLYDIFQTDFVPAFRDQNYDTAVLNIYSSMDGCYKQAFNGSSSPVVATYTPYVESGTQQSGGISLIGLVIVLVLVFLIFSAIDKSRYRRWAANGRGGYNKASFVPLLFWHRPGGRWFRSMEDRYRTGGPGYRGGGPDFRGGVYNSTPSYRSSTTFRTPGSTFRSTGSSFRSSSGTRGPGGRGFGTGSFGGRGFGGRMGGGRPGGRGFGGR